MESRLTRAEYWLLETVVEMPVPLCFLNPKRYEECDGIEMMFNKPGHGLGLSQLTETLNGLFQGEFIEAFAHEGASTLTFDQIGVALEQSGPIRRSDTGPCSVPSCLYYRLTSRGGELWESFAAPDWERYVKTDIDEEAQAITLTSKTPWRIHGFFEDMQLVLYEIDSTFGHSEILGPWNATYWKVLPSGYRTHLRWQKDIPLDPGHNLHWLALVGYCQDRDGWYRWR